MHKKYTYTRAYLCVYTYIHMYIYIHTHTWAVRACVSLEAEGMDE